MGFALRKNQLPHYTYEDYKHWEGKWELICGIPYSMSPSPAWKHQRVNTNIISQFDQLFKKEKCKCMALMALDWIINDNTVVEPDISVTCKPIEGKFLTNTPEIIFEILSPSTTLKDKNIKFNIYQSEGVTYYIMVNPTSKSYEIFHLTKGKYIKESSIKKSFEFKLKNCNIPFDFNTIWAD
jgi:Uma2 family endonuclease